MTIVIFLLAGQHGFQREMITPWETCAKWIVRLETRRWPEDDTASALTKQVDNWYAMMIYEPTVMMQIICPNVSHVVDKKEEQK